MVNEKKPDLLVGYGGWMDLFFKTLWAKKIEISPPKMVLYMAEALPHGAREHIEGNFGIPVMSRYSAAEAFKIGFYCEKRTGFHVHEDLCHVRIIGTEGQALAAGQIGQIVISNLINRGSVFLNYRIGDMGSMSDQACPCGRTFKLLSELEGRVEDLLPLADGRIVHPRAMWEVFKHTPVVLQYQLTQHEISRFELKLTTANDDGFRQAIEETLPRLHRVLGPEAKIDASRRTDFNRDGRKFRAVSSLVKSNR
jgi:phenylacetate-CoA ligase